MWGQLLIGLTWYGYALMTSAFIHGLLDGPIAHCAALGICG